MLRRAVERVDRLAADETLRARLNARRGARLARQRATGDEGGDIFAAESEFEQ